MPISGPSPLFSPMQIDTQPPAPVPPLPSFLNQQARASMKLGSAEHSQGSAGTDQGSDGSPKLPIALGALGSSVTALQHLAGRAAQEAAASQGADEETASQVRCGLSYVPHHLLQRMMAACLYCLVHPCVSLAFWALHCPHTSAQGAAGVWSLQDRLVPVIRFQ